MVKHRKVFLDPEKLANLQKLQPLTCQKDLEAFLRLVGYYAPLIPNIAKINGPLMPLLKEDAHWE